jgi:hypothetical protein
MLKSLFGILVLSSVVYGQYGYGRRDERGGRGGRRDGRGRGVSTAAAAA